LPPKTISNSGDRRLARFSDAKRKVRPGEFFNEHLFSATNTSHSTASSACPGHLRTAHLAASRRIKPRRLTGPGYQISQTTRTEERRRKEGPSERRPWRQIWHRESLTTKSVRQSPKLSQRHKGFGPFRLSRLELVRPSYACMQDEAGRRSIRVAAVELRALERRCSRPRWTTV
jgi:hypothetical protein